MIPCRKEETMVEITLLGTGGTLPVKGKWLSSAMIRCLGLTILLDCGEGTQMAARAANMPLSGIDVICITHYHGDHIAGLPGMLLSIGHEGRTRPVDIYGPPGLAAVVNALRVLAPSLPFEVRLHELSGKTDEPFYSSGHISLGAFPLDHSVPCLGYTFDLFRPGKFDIKKAKENNVPMAFWKILQNCDSVRDADQTLYTSDMVLGPSREGIHVLFATDTRPTPLLEQKMKGRTLCIVEGMYGSDDKREKAVETSHMTFIEVAFMASRAKPENVWLTHFSPSLPDPENYIDDARSIYPNIMLGSDGMQTVLRYKDD